MAAARNRNRSGRAPEPGVAGPARGRDVVLVRDRSGRLWLCPPGVDENGDLLAQGCWRSDGPDLADVVRRTPTTGRKGP
ncbi:MAG: hypothetical protein IH621_18930 [Krumholzibacteria bacterium]|nr:hypothetical protein [Candidatus Krumholzibacteria bacterium]